MTLSLGQSIVYTIIFFLYLSIIFFIGFRAAKREKKSFFRALYGLDRGKNSPLNFFEKLLIILITWIFGLFIFVFVLHYKLPWQN